jgi:hypothetical protein
MRSNWDYYAIKRIPGKVKTHILRSKTGVPLRMKTSLSKSLASGAF